MPNRFRHSTFCDYYVVVVVVMKQVHFSATFGPVQSSQTELVTEGLHLTPAVQKLAVTYMQSI